jgi:hypothetical protein
MNTKRFLAVAGGVLAVIILIAAISYFNRQQTRLDGLTSDINSLRSEFGANLDSKLEILKVQIFEELTRQNSNVFNASYTVGNLNATNNTATLRVSFSLRNYNTTDPVTVHYRLDGKACSSAATRDGNVFQADLPVKIAPDPWSEENAFDISYSTGTVSVQSEKIMTVDPTYDLFSRIESYVWFQSISYSDVTQIVDVQIDPFSILNRFGGDAKLKFVSCRLQIRYEDTLVHEMDLMNNASVDGEIQVFSVQDPILVEWDTEGLLETTDYEEFSGLKCFLVATDGYGFEYDLPTDLYQ